MAMSQPCVKRQMLANSLMSKKPIEGGVLNRPSDIRPRPLQTEDKYVLRLPDGMRDRIKAAAEKNNRSMNAEIVATLEEAYPEPEYTHEQFIDDWIAPIYRADDFETAQALTQQANEFLSQFTDKIGVRVKPRETEDGMHLVWFGFRGIKELSFDDLSKAPPFFLPSGPDRKRDILRRHERELEDERIRAERRKRARNK